MAITSNYFHTGTGVQNNVGVTFDIVGKDFNPTAPSNLITWSRYPLTVIWTAPTDMTNYRHWHEIVVLVAEWINNDTVSRTAELKIGFDFAWGNNWIYSFGTQTLAANWWYYAGYAYAGIDYDEFNQNGTATFIQYQWSSGIATITKVYTWYNTARETQRTAGRLWVEWDYLHYTDASYNSSTGYEHLIDNDWTSSYVWTDKSGAMWLADDGNNRRIYYVDSSGYKRRTYLANDRYWWVSYVWTSKAWYMRVSSGDTVDWYGYLCFVWYNWYKYRIMNWPV